MKTIKEAQKNVQSAKAFTKQLEQSLIERSEELHDTEQWLALTAESEKTEAFRLAAGGDREPLEAFKAKLARMKTDVSDLEEIIRQLNLDIEGARAASGEAMNRLSTAKRSYFAEKRDSLVLKHSSVLAEVITLHLASGGQDSTLLDSFGKVDPTLLKKTLAAAAAELKETVQ